jgi:ribose/xylose/arabinose/galactoside ABC-type transport system permease subunit
MSDSPQQTTPSNEPQRWLNLRHAFSKWLGTSVGLMVVWSLFAMLIGRNFVVWSNQRLMLLQTAVVGTAAVGATLVIISGGIDLSVGSAIALGTVVLACLLQAGVPPLAAAIATILFSFVVGWIVGQLVTGRVGWFLGWVLAAVPALWIATHLSKPWWFASVAILAVGWPLSHLLDRWLGTLPLSPFIVTLGMWGALRGVAKGLGNNQPIYPEQTWLTQLMTPASSGPFALLAPGVWLMLLLALFMAGVLRYTRFGRHVYAIGANEQTARLCGVPVVRHKRWIFGISSACAGLAAVLQFAFLSGVGDPTTAEGTELRVIASVVIGGASLAGGEGTILGTLFGAFIMTVVDNGCTKWGIDNWVQDIVTGGIILAAVALDQVRHRKS